MKRFFLVSLAVGFGMMVLGASILRTVQPEALAAVLTGEETLVGGEIERAQTASASAKIDYYLPYPGILPDHPLYFLKMVRDRVKLMLVRDEVERLKLMLLYADKRVGAAKALAEGNKHDLAMVTAAKAENYMFQVIDSLNRLELARPGVREMWKRVELATGKHVEVLEEIIDRSPDQIKAAVAKSVDISREGQRKAKEILEGEQEEQQGETQGETVEDEQKDEGVVEEESENE